MEPMKHINQSALWMRSISMTLAKADWNARDTREVAFSNVNVPAYTAEEIFDESVTFKNGESVRLVSCEIEGERAKAFYETVKEGHVVPKKRPKKKAAKKKSKKEIVEDMVEDAIEDIFEAMDEME